MTRALVPEITAPERFDQLRVEFDPELDTLFCLTRPGPRPCFNRTLLGELAELPTLLRELGVGQAGEWGTQVHLVFASELPGVFNLGGDLEFFLACIRNRDRDGLTRYAKACIDALYPASVGYGLPVTTISVVQGAALGGGMESVLATDVIIAERQATMGLPEVLFNLFPGMGGYHFLARRIGAAAAEDIIMSGRTWSAEQLYERGVVDVLAEPGEGIALARRLVARRNRYATTTAAMRQVRRHDAPVSYETLIETTKVWVEAALRLRERDLKVIERLLQAQKRMARGIENATTRRDPAAREVMSASG